MAHVDKLGKLLVEASENLLECGMVIEQALGKVLKVAEDCSPEIARVATDTMTKITRDISAAPLFFAEQVNADGPLMRRVVQVLASVLEDAEPQKARDEAGLNEALATTASLCKKHKMPDEVGTLFALLVQEVARVFFELRAILKRQKVCSVQTSLS